MPLTSPSPAVRGSGFYFAFFAALAAWIPFINVYFHDLGLEGWQIGLLSALLPAATFLLATPFTALADRHGRHLRVLSLGCVGLGLSLLLFIVPTDFAVLLGLMAILAVCYSPLTPLADSTVAGMALRHGLNYGGMRLWGSLSFALVSIGSGALWQRLGYHLMFAVAAGLYLLVAWSARGLEDTAAGERTTGIPLRGILRDRFLVILLLSTFLAGSAVGMDITFAGIYMTHLGGNGFFVGMIFGLSAVFELPTMRYSERISSLLGGPGCLMLAYGLFGIAYLGYAFSPTPAVMLAFSVARGLAYGLFYASTIRLISTLAPPTWSGTLQGIMNSLGIGLAQLLSRPLSGIIYDTLGPPSVYLASAACVAAALLLMSTIVGMSANRRTDAGRPPDTASGGDRAAG
jgi:PPP family 3-phenylpropionic acid transporter